MAKLKMLNVTRLAPIVTCLLVLLSVVHAEAGNPAIDAGTPISGYLFNGSAPDIGAFETIVFFSASILDDAMDNKMVINFTNNVFPPLLPATGCTGFAVRKNGASNQINSCTRTGTNQFTLILTNGYINTDTAQFDYDPATGNVTDSALIGNRLNQRLNAITNAPAVTTALGGGGTPPVLDQVACLFCSYGGLEAAPDSCLPVGRGLTIPPGGCSTVRCQVSNTVANALISSYTFFAQENGTGGYLAIPNGPTPAGGLSFPTGTSTPPPELVAGPTTEHLNGTGTFVPGSVLLSAMQIPNIPLTAGQDTELLFPFCTGLSTAGKFFDLRIYGAGGVALNTYTQTPRLTISATGHSAYWGAR